jgi:antitoxin component YwqK of YwqJK toxin-antitoxin module
MKRQILMCILLVLCAGCSQTEKKEKFYDNGQISRRWYQKSIEAERLTLKDGTVLTKEITVVDGEEYYWYENGAKKELRMWVDGVLQGVQTEWYENGQKKSETEYRNGWPQGKWKRWSQDGQTVEEGENKYTSRPPLRMRVAKVD